MGGVALVEDLMGICLVVRHDRRGVVALVVREDRMGQLALVVRDDRMGDEIRLGIGLDRMDGVACGVGYHRRRLVALGDQVRLVVREDRMGGVAFVNQVGIVAVR